MIIYFSGTGNSRFVAEKISEKIGDELFDSFSYIRQGKGADFTASDQFVFVCPVYVAAPPLVWMDFIRQSRFPKNSRAYFVMVCVSHMGSSPAYCQRLCVKSGLTYYGTAKVDMPQNYIAYFKMKTPEENRAVIRAALPKINKIASVIGAGRPLPDPGMKTWERLLTPMVLKPYYKLFVSAKLFFASENCIGCGRCVSVCPLQNLTLSEKKPVWGSRCTHCMACINLCPSEAIEYGSKTQGKPRYHGPEQFHL